jgi:hypothetical protein
LIEGTAAVIKSYALHDIPVNHIASMERWYNRDHAPEIVRRYGPWLTRFESYLPVPAPADAQEYGFYNWRMTEGWWRELPAGDLEKDAFFTPPRISPRVAACFVPVRPTEVFVQGGFLPLEKAPIRWLMLLRYPDGVSCEQGEEWFLSTHAPEVAQQPGLLRFHGYQVILEDLTVPGNWRADTAPPGEQVQTSWHRVSELWYETFDDWRQAVGTTPPAYTKPSWATQETFPFVDVASTFLLERPNDDYLKDLRGYVP